MHKRVKVGFCPCLLNVRGLSPGALSRLRISQNDVEFLTDVFVSQCFRDGPDLQSPSRLLGVTRRLLIRYEAAGILIVRFSPLRLLFRPTAGVMLGCNLHRVRAQPSQNNILLWNHLSYVTQLLFNCFQNPSVTADCSHCRPIFTSSWRFIIYIFGRVAHCCKTGVTIYKSIWKKGGCSCAWASGHHAQCQASARGSKPPSTGL